MQIDLNLIPIFRMVAEEKSFTSAADRLGMGRSAVSQAVRRLEDLLGVMLFIRTTRSVSLTEAGEAVLQRVAAPLSEAMGELDLLRTAVRPAGTLRLSVSSIAEAFLAGPMLVEFARDHPEVTLDITVTDIDDELSDWAYDAGVRLRESIAPGMVALPVSGPQREVVVATPAYLARAGMPEHPRDLAQHSCIGWRVRPDIAPHRWEFEEDGRAFSVAVSPYITTNDLHLMIRTALCDGGITFAPYESLRSHIESGALVPMLESYLPPFSGFYLFYPQRENMPAKLRAFVDYVKGWQKDLMRGS
ncbi:LysR family transcriptional regulator [Halodurantibacterium flavum]|uniref:LysR family transcriptional regulator n=1 Tax=Halodurantibacterium flavum TaxID=1382802 RepID=A0ABW4S292_9RHOB